MSHNPKPPSLDRLVRRLYDARQDAAAAKKARAEHAAETGQCKSEDGPCYLDMSLSEEEWCPICKAKKPLWDDYQRKSALAGAALRNLLRVAKTLPT